MSAFFPKPTYQTNITSLIRRGVPDICGDADPNTGYECYSAALGGWFVVGGTSAVSPLWAALTARINQQLGTATSTNQMQRTLYTTNPSCCRDVVTGNNGAFTASTGWDRCTGFGSPNGQAVLTSVQNTGAPPNPPAVPNPVAKFTASPTSAKGNTLVTFSNQSTDAVSYLWSFGNSSTSTDLNPTKTYTPGTYTVSLVATNSEGTTNTLTRSNYITITAPNPAASFTASPTKSKVTTRTGKVNVTFTNNSTGATRYLWIFGDGTTSSLTSPVHAYRIGKYNIKLVAYNTNNVASTQVRNGYITISR
jgi:PKD repeat protein